MKLKSLKLKNFRTYCNETIIGFNDLTALIGKNDIGKSTILESLEIFFNNSTVCCEKDDLSVNSTDTNIEITCTFTNLPAVLVLDSAVSTTLQDEYLLNSDGDLEIKKIFSATAAKPKEKIFINCLHPTATNYNDLLLLKRAELKARANSLGIDNTTYNANINSEIRHAIWASRQIDELSLSEISLLVDKEDSKKVYDELQKYLPIFALFQSDRQSKDDDKEVTDPMKLAIQQALSDLNLELEEIKSQVQQKALETANRTLTKLHEMDPDLANSLMPEFKSEPKYDSIFKLTIKSDNDIPINKRGSGVRRLILLNFFRAEAERRMHESNNNSIIYAFEEPETSQHPDHQRLLLNAFKELSLTSNCQVMLTTHTPALASLLPLNSLRYIHTTNSNCKEILAGTDSVFESICNALGVLPDPIPNNTQALLLVEGKGDVTFINHTAFKLKEGGFIPHTLQEKNFAIVPIGGCGNLKHWVTMRLATQFNVPWCILLDSDKGTPEEIINTSAVSELKLQGIKAYVTQKREPENYIHPNCLQLRTRTLTYSDTDDAKKLISTETSIKKENVLDTMWIRMTTDQIRDVEQFTDSNGNIHFELTEMINDFLTLVD